MTGKFNGNLLNENDIQNLILSQNQVVLPESKLQSVRRAAVLVPLLRDNGDWHILYTRRANTVNTHKGQVSFPGGSAEPEDINLEATALREAQEEIGLRFDNVRVIGRIAEFLTISDYVITPVVGRIIRWPFPVIPMDSEVDRVFTIPVHWLCDPSHWEEKETTLANGRIERVIYYHTYDHEVLWGITARITNWFLKCLQLIP